MNAENFIKGQVILIDKPLKWTSFQVVNKSRWAIKKKYNLKKLKVGHAGTLDPLATGLLILCTGKFTKKIEQFQAEKKEYTGTITLGATTPSFDLETEQDQSFPIDHISEDLIHQTTKKFTGILDQTPPLYSAIKKDGVRLYELARKGETTEIKSRKIEIETFEITNIKLPKIEFRVVCSKGTYIRSLANDFGKALKTGGHLSSLRRTKSGALNIIDSTSPKAFLNELGLK